MGKKSQRTSQTSKGERRSLARDVVKSNSQRLYEKWYERY